MNQHPMVGEWRRVVRYFKSKVRERNRDSRRSERPSVPNGNDATKGAKGF